MSQTEVDPTPAGQGMLSFELLLAKLSAGFINLPAAKVDAEVETAQLRRAGTRSTAVVPLVAGGTVIGGLSFAMLTRERVRSESDARRFQLIAQVFANALERKRADQTLHQVFDEVQKLRERLHQENVYLRGVVRGWHKKDPVIGRSAAIRSAVDQALQAAPTASTVLLLGETGGAALQGCSRKAEVPGHRPARRETAMSDRLTLVGRDLETLRRHFMEC